MVPHRREGAGRQGHEWLIEGGSPNQLIRMGVTKNTVPIGTELTIEGYQAKDGGLKPWAGTSCSPMARACSSAARRRRWDARRQEVDRLKIGDLDC